MRFKKPTKDNLLDFFTIDEVNNLVGKKFSATDIEKFIKFIEYFMWARAKHEYNMRLGDRPIDNSFEIKAKGWLELIETLRTYMTW